MSHIFGNHTYTFVGGKNTYLGVNGYRSIMPGTPVQIVGKAGDIVFVSMQNIISVKLDQGICIQAVAGNVKYSVTLQDPKLACNTNEVMQKSISWANETTASPGEVTLLSTPCITAMKLEFLSDASFYIYAR